MIFSVERMTRAADHQSAQTTESTRLCLLIQSDSWVPERGAGHALRAKPCGLFAFRLLAGIATNPTNLNRFKPEQDRLVSTPLQAVRTLTGIA